MSEPKVGDIWVDRSGEHNLVLRVRYCKEADDIIVHILCLDTGREFTDCPIYEFDTNDYFYMCVA